MMNINCKRSTQFITDIRKSITTLINNFCISSISLQVLIFIEQDQQIWLTISVLNYFTDIASLNNINHFFSSICLFRQYFYYHIHITE